MRNRAHRPGDELPRSVAYLKPGMLRQEYSPLERDVYELRQSPHQWVRTRSI